VNGGGGSERKTAKAKAVSGEELMAGGGEKEAVTSHSCVAAEIQLLAAGGKRMRRAQLLCQLHPQQEQEKSGI
jgi:hypothetical protein